MNFTVIFQGIYQDWNLKSLKRMAIIGLVSLLVVVLFMEMFTPLYGPVRRLFYSYQELATARQQRIELAATEEFVFSIGKQYSVFCPDQEKWAALTPADQAVWHEYWTKTKKQVLFGNTTTCYDP